MSPVQNADGRVNSRVANYVGFFDKDSSKDGQAHQENRLENYTDVVNGASSCSSLYRVQRLMESLGDAGYYDGATELYEYGWAESFHFSRFYKGEGFKQSVRSRHSFSLPAGAKWFSST